MCTALPSGVSGIGGYTTVKRRQKPRLKPIDKRDTAENRNTEFTAKL
jgi:hypothetical protein